MRLGNRCLFVLFSCLVMQATIIDRIAIIVGDAVIKDSDIERDIRVVSFLNRQKLSFDPDMRRASANRLIDQSIIQREIDVGEYRVASDSDAKKFLVEIEHDRSPTPVVFQRSLSTYGLTVDQLTEHLRWQLTVLRFIDQRFRPAVLATDEQIQQYYQQHVNEFRDPKTGRTKDLNAVRSDVQEAVTNELINKQFDSWLNVRRKSTKIDYREERLK